jgi:hypothetical protein
MAHQRIQIRTMIAFVPFNGQLECQTAQQAQNAQNAESNCPLTSSRIVCQFDQTFQYALKKTPAFRLQGHPSTLESNIPVPSAAAGVFKKKKVIERRHKSQIRGGLKRGVREAEKRHLRASQTQGKSIVFLFVLQDCSCDMRHIETSQ